LRKSATYSKTSDDAPLTPEGSPFPKAIAKIIDRATVEAVGIPSTGSRPERDRLAGEFAKKAERVHDGEVLPVVIRT
jgi:hypothetical protein